MGLLTFLRRCVTAIRRPRLEEDLRDEIDAHIEQRVRQLVADGMDPRDALYEARRIFGNVTFIREESRDMWGFRAIDTMGQDLRYGLRMLRRSPAFTAVAVLSLAIGIAATAAVFSLAVLLFRKLPVRAPDELVVFRWFSGATRTFESLNGYSAADDTGFSSTSFSRAAYETLRRELAARADVFGFADLYRVNLSIDGRPETAFGHAVSGNYYSTLGVRPAAGRLISDDDDRMGAGLVAVISHDFWQRRFAGADAVGRAVVLNGVTLTIVGVAPQGFRGTLQVAQPHDISVPLSVYPLVTRGDDPASPNYWWVLMMARLEPAVRPEHVQPDADVILKRTVAAAKPELPASALPRLALDPGSRGQLEDRDTMRDPLKAMALVVGIVLLVACANVANLLLARGHARTRELAVRVAIGAPRRRVVRQLLTEGLLLAALGCTLGLLFAKSIATSLLPALSAQAASPVLVYSGLDWRVLLFTSALATACSVLFGLAPALRATDLKVASGLQEASRSAIGVRHRNRLSGSLVIVQVALSMLLVTAAALLVYSVRNLQRIDPGFDPRGVLIFRIDPEQNGYDEARTRNLYASAVERLAALPGVRGATFSSHTLIANSSSIGTARPAGAPAPAPGSPDAQKFISRHRVWRLVIGDDFLRAMGIRMMAGRAAGPSDTASSQPVAVINVSAAQQLFGTADAVGRRFVLGLAAGTPEVEVIGIAADAKYTSVKSKTPPTIYLPHRQRPLGAATFAVRAQGDPASFAGLVRETMRQVDPNVPLFDVRTQDQQIRASLQQERLFAQLATLLGGVTLLLAAIGLYGLLAYSVTRRTPEIGVRMALGAERGAVRWMILRQSLVLVIAGLAIGIPGAIAGSRFVESMLFGLEPADPIALAVAAVALLAISLAAAFVPAQRASRVDPIVALRSE